MEFPVYPLKKATLTERNKLENTDTDKTKTLRENYLYVFEKVDLDDYKVQDNITIINPQKGSILNTKELSNEIPYVYYYGSKLSRN